MLVSSVGQCPRRPNEQKNCIGSNSMFLQALNVIEHRNDDVNGIPRRELAKLLYGKDSVFARNATPQQVQSIQRSDVVSYVETWERPDNAVLGISGQILLIMSRRLQN